MQKIDYGEITVVDNEENRRLLKQECSDDEIKEMLTKDG